MIDLHALGVSQASVINGLINLTMLSLVQSFNTLIASLNVYKMTQFYNTLFYNINLVSQHYKSIVDCMTYNILTS